MYKLSSVLKRLTDTFERHSGKEIPHSLMINLERCLDLRFNRQYGVLQILCVDIILCSNIPHTLIYVTRDNFP